MVSSCCDAKSMIGEKIVKATYGYITRYMGYCSKSNRCSIFKEVIEDDYLLGDGFLNEFTRDVVVPFAKAYNKIDKKKEK